MTEQLVEPEAPDDDLVYRRVVRTLYIVGLALNVWLIWEMVKDSSDVQIQVGKLKSWWKRNVQDCEGCAKRKKALRKATNRMLFQAEQIVTEESGVSD